MSKPELPPLFILSKYRREILTDIQEGRGTFPKELPDAMVRNRLWALDWLRSQGLIEIGARLTPLGLKALEPTPLGELKARRFRRKKELLEIREAKAKGKPAMTDRELLTFLATNSFTPACDPALTHATVDATEADRSITEIQEWNKVLVKANIKTSSTYWKRHQSRLIRYGNWTYDRTEDEEAKYAWLE